jgi:hypothetical protein
MIVENADRLAYVSWIISGELDMTEQDIHFLKQCYKRLRAMYDAGQLDAQQLAKEVGKLQAQDQLGNWWTLNPWDGSFLRYNGSQWIPDSPPQVRPQPERHPMPPARPPSAIPASDKKGWLPLVSLLGILLPLFTAFIWFAYTSLSPRSEGWDCLTPLIIGGVPILLVMFQGPVDRLLLPLQPFRRKVPPALLLGLALAVPVIFGCLCSSATYAGYGALRFASVIGMLGAHVLTRNPEVRS